MKKVMMLSLVLAGLLSPLVYAETVVDTGTVVNAETVMDAGNTMCPVGEDKVSGKDFVEYQGKKYGLCCAMCAGKFNKNPEKYLAEMSEREKTQDHHDHAM